MGRQVLSCLSHFCKHNSSETTEPNFIKIYKCLGHVLLCIFDLLNFVVVVAFWTYQWSKLSVQLFGNYVTKFHETLQVVSTWYVVVHNTRKILSSWKRLGIKCRWPWSKITNSWISLRGSESECHWMGHCVFMQVVFFHDLLAH